jgi:hypothetical protein
MKILLAAISLSFVGGFLNSAHSADGPPKNSKTLDQSTSRVFVYRTDAALGWIGVDFSVGGRRYSRLSKEEFDVVELPTGEINIEVIQGGLSLEVCQKTLVIDPLKDNFLKIRNREGGLARHLFTGSLLMQALDKSKCGGVNEIIKVTSEDAVKELPKMKFSPLTSPVDSKMTKENICNFVTGGKGEDCRVTFENIGSYSPVTYIASSASSQTQPPARSVAQPSPQATNLGIAVRCKVETNPIIEVEISACLAIKGTVVDAESYGCVIGKNPPIKLSPQLCIQGGGQVTRGD